MKIIAFYLPQFHEVPENNEWWGKGFTEWNNVKSGVKFIEGQRQPRIPLNGNYYDLEDKKILLWQAELAHKYGVYGFCFYHYWISGKLMLYKPLEIFLKNSDIKINFCFCWANHNWTNAWVSENTKILLEQTYGGIEDWKAHFEYLLPFFKDKRYIKNDNKPLFVFYDPVDVPKLNEMLEYWETEAKKAGFSGIEFAYQGIALDLKQNGDKSHFTYDIEFQPQYAMSLEYQKKWRNIKKIKRIIASFLQRNFSIYLRGDRFRKLIVRSYDEVWEHILQMKPMSDKSIPGAFVDWDNTARRGNRGSICINSSPEKFERYLSKQILHAKEDYKSDYIFLFAWNEWGECGYLEPDEENRYKNLEAIKNALLENCEFPY